LIIFILESALIVTILSFTVVVLGTIPFLEKPSTLPLGIRTWFSVQLRALSPMMRRNAASVLM